ncbi:hypothetical protein EV188_110102 [Actinomycetospora succinea]|uniref:Uncharacterized protein n=2 Tax=Actinomycetospora succinea TaxID=663603 RepID=A0A4R6UV20_9PSEU|nr:hypothetical protein EV188_110102 [Actinomycetospora succinea]
MMLRRAFWIGLFSGLMMALSVGSGVALPNPPGGQTSTFIDAAAGEVCTFPVLVETTAAQNVRATLPNGLLVITGPATATATNKATGESRSYNISGPGKFDPATNRLTLAGQSLIVQPSSVGSPFLITTSGRVGFVLNQPIDQPLRGHISHDICAELS